MAKPRIEWVDRAPIHETLPADRNDLLVIYQLPDGAIEAATRVLPSDVEQQLRLADLLASLADDVRKAAWVS